MPTSEGLCLRIEINLGDIIVEDDGDVYGEGVNVAARLEAMCEPGSVLVSSKIHEEVGGKVEASFEHQGEKHAKNISTMVRVFAGRGPGEVPARRQAVTAPALRTSAWIAVGAAVLVLAGLGGVARTWFGTAVPPAMLREAAAPATGDAFDGTWRLVIECPPIESPKAAGYVQRLTATMTDGALCGSLGTLGQPGWFQIEGRVSPTGLALLSARGLAYDPSQAVGGPAAGSNVEYTVEVTFDGRTGRVRRTQLRTCDLTFER